MTSLYAPVHKIPVELLRQIFLLATHGLDDKPVPGPPEASFASMGTPWKLTGVNRRWRMVGRGISKLWTSICVEGTHISHFPDRIPEFDRDCNIYRQFMTEHLELSKEEPLDIFIDGQDPLWDREPEPTERTIYPIFTQRKMKLVISLLLPHLLRWRSLSIYTDEWSPMCVALEAIEDDMKIHGAPVLEKLDLLHSNAEPGRGKDFFPSYMEEPWFLSRDLRSQNLVEISVLPRLKSLRLYGVHVHWKALPVILSHSSADLSRLELLWQPESVGPTLSELYQLLSACPSLVVLDIHESAELNPSDQPETRKAPLHRLRKLKLGYSSVAIARAILDIIDAPDVEGLSLECIDLADEVNQSDNGKLLSYIGTGNFSQLDDHDFSLYYPTSNDYQNLLVENRFPQAPPIGMTDRAMFPRLERFHLDSPRVNVRPLQFFLASVPRLQRLELTNTTTDPIRALLSPQQESTGDLTRVGPCCCPQLQSLHVGFLYYNDCDSSGLISIAECLSSARPSNGGMGSTLKSVEFLVFPGTGLTKNKTEFVNTGSTAVKFIIPGRRFDDDEDEDEDDDEDEGEDDEEDDEEHEEWMNHD